MEADGTVTNLTRVGGLIVNGSSTSGADYTAGLWVHDGAAVSFGRDANGGITSGNNEFNGGAGNVESYGILATDSELRPLGTSHGGSAPWNAGVLAVNSDLIWANDISVSGGSGTNSHGMVFTAGASPSGLGGGTISGGSGSDSSIGILLDGASPASFVAFADITGGSGGSSSIGVLNINGSPVNINRCVIDGGSSPVSTVGVQNDNSDAKFGSNIMTGGTGSTGVGMLNIDSSPFVRNNIIVGGNGSTEAAGVDNTG
jgi:hypothetical protein